MSKGFVWINWSMQHLTAEQQAVMAKIAAYYLRRSPKKEWVDFTHLLIEGRLTYKSDGLFVTYAGHFFHADFGKVNGVDWTADFMLLKGMEHLLFDEQLDAVHFQQIGNGPVRRLSYDPVLARVSEASLLD